MAHWYNVYHNDDFEAEIQVGLYDQWLRQLGTGPTQADRVLIHTDMMDLAHERRFAVCEAGIDMSGFEANHSHRVKQAIDHLQSHFTAHASTEPDDSDDYLDAALIGLTQLPSRSTPNDCSQFATCSGGPPAKSAHNEFYFMLCEAQQKEERVARGLAADALALDAEEEDYAAFQREIYGELLAARKRFRGKSPGSALQMKPIRYRREHRTTTKDSAKRTSYVRPHNANVV